MWVEQPVSLISSALTSCHTCLFFLFFEKIDFYFCVCMYVSVWVCMSVHTWIPEEGARSLGAGKLELQAFAGWLVCDVGAGRQILVLMMV